VSVGARIGVILSKTESFATVGERSDNGVMEAQVAEPAGREDVATEPADPGAERGERGLRFEDPYWDDAFCAWWDGTLRTCC
jgi:hypothetical protein